MAEYRDCEYGDYRGMNNEAPHWSECFKPTNSALKKAWDDYKAFRIDFLDNVAQENRLNTDDWGLEDYEQFAEIMEI